MSHSWTGWIGSVINTPDPVQAWFNKSSPWPLDHVEGGSNCANITAINSATDAINNIWQCALYPNVTDRYRQGLLSETQEAILLADHLDTSLARAATVTVTISSCLSAYCESLGDCKQRSPDVCLASSLGINGSMLNRDAMDTCLNTICASNPEPLTNTDIAGIGIVFSYIIQIGITILSAMALAFLAYLRMVNGDNETAEWHIASQVPDPAEPTKNHHETSIEAHHAFLPHEVAGVQRGSETQRKSTRGQEIYDAIIVALVDFLKAQCFVAIAISTAALIVLNSGADVTLLDFTAVGAASGVCIIPITFNYYVLAAFNTDRNHPERKSWYLYILSLCSWILGLCVVLSPQMFAANQDNKSSTFQFLYGTQYPNACGNFSPVSLCPLTHAPNVHPEYAFYYTLCVPVMLGLTIWQMTALPWVHKFLSPLLLRDGKSNTSFFAFVHLAALGFFVAPLVFFFTSLNDLFTYGAVSGEWTFGQIIGVTVWIPSVTGLINTLLNGVGDAHTPQLPVGYTTEKTSDRHMI